MRLNGFWLKFVVGVACAALLRRVFAIMMRKTVRGQRVLITGGASGIGRQLALQFASHKAKIVLWDVNESGMLKVAKELEDKGAEVWAYVVNLAEREEIYNTAEKVRTDVGKIDILINNAGIVSGKNILDVSDKMAQLTLDVNTAAHFWTVRAFLPAMIRDNKGHIVTIASAAGLNGVYGLADYCASKFGAVGFDESLRVFLRKNKHNGVKTTCICPFYINTGMFEGAKTRLPFVLPILDETWVAQTIFDAIRENRAFLALPWSVHYLLPLQRALLPTWLFDQVNDWIGINSSMDDFVGRR